MRWRSPRARCLCVASAVDRYVTIELVDYETGRNVNSQWYHKSPAQRKTLNPVWPESNSARWRDVHLPFETIALKVQKGRATFEKAVLFARNSKYKEGITRF